jgi:hypothetical protein
VRVWTANGALADKPRRRRFLAWSERTEQLEERHGTAGSCRIERPGELREALRQAFAHDGPALVDVVTDPAALAIRPRITPEQVTGFALSASRTVLSGGVGRMVHLARANLRNIPRP